MSQGKSKEPNSIFHVSAYMKDYYFNRKLIGTITLEHKDRKTFGYQCRRTETLKRDVIFDNKKKLKAGLVVETELLPLCGRSNIRFFGSKKRTT